MGRGLRQRPGGAGQRLDGAPALANEIADRSARQLDEVGWLDVGRNGSTQRALVFRLRRKIVGDAERRHAGDAIHGGVMHLDVDGESVALQSFDEMVLPQGARMVERNGVKLRHQIAQLRHRSGLRQRGMANVIVEVQFVVDHPGRMIDAERRRFQPAAVGRQEIEPRRRMVAKAGEETVLKRRRLEDRHAPDLHRRLGRLHIEEEGVERGETIHGEPTARRRAPADAVSSACRQCSAISSTRSGTQRFRQKMAHPGDHAQPGARDVGGG